MIFFFIKKWKETLSKSSHCGGNESLLIISYANFLTVFRFEISQFLSLGNDNCPNLLLTLCKEMPLPFKMLLCNYVLPLVLPLTSYDLYSQTLSVYERSIKLFLFFLGCFYFRMHGNLLIYRKRSISRLLWGDRWKLQGEIQRHAIVITYMFMTNDRCEDSFV